MGKGGITLKVLGDFGPFSRVGKSIGYLVSVGGEHFLVDCGSPLFNQIGGHGIKDITGLLITHCHDDHKRWFSDLALFHRYAPDFHSNIFLLATEDVLAGLIDSSAPAIDRSLSMDSERIIDIGFDEYADVQLIGPKARFRIATLDHGNGAGLLRVVDDAGEPLPPDRAKVVVSARTGRHRMLFRDPASGEWIEPESFYTFRSTAFYHSDRNVYRGDGFTIEAIKAPVWHGIPGFGVKFSTGTDTLFFTSDTAHNLDLWERLCDTKRPQQIADRAAFDAAHVIHGDINDYIERIWSRERYDEAVASFAHAFVVHDISLMKSVVHTDYIRLGNTVLERPNTLLTHSPDRITSEWMLCCAEKTFRIHGDRICEEVDGQLYEMDADIYHKEAGKFYAGYRREGGAYKVYRRDGVLNVFPFGLIEGLDPGEHIYNVDIFEDMDGRYYPKIDAANAYYRTRRDGRVERVEVTHKGSTGRVVAESHPRAPAALPAHAREAAR